MVAGQKTERAVRVIVMRPQCIKHFRLQMLQNRGDIEYSSYMHEAIRGVPSCEYCKHDHI